jgi:hypothetical protein
MKKTIVVILIALGAALLSSACLPPVEIPTPTPTTPATVQPPTAQPTAQPTPTRTAHPTHTAQPTREPTAEPDWNLQALCALSLFGDGTTKADIFGSFDVPAGFTGTIEVRLGKPSIGITWGFGVLVSPSGHQTFKSDDFVYFVFDDPQPTTLDGWITIVHLNDGPDGGLPVSAYFECQQATQ